MTKRSTYDLASVNLLSVGDGDRIGISRSHARPQIFHRPAITLNKNPSRHRSFLASRWSYRRGPTPPSATPLADACAASLGFQGMRDRLDSLGECFRRPIWDSIPSYTLHPLKKTYAYR